MADIDTRIDPFSGTGALDASWTTTTPAGSTIVQGSGYVEFTSTTGGSGEEVTRADDVTAYNFADGNRTYAQLTIPSACKYAYLVVLDASGDGVGFRVDSGGNLNRQSWASGSGSNESSVAYDSTNHRWLSFRRSGSNIVFECAPDSSGSPGTWAAAFTLAAPGAMDLTAVKHRLAVSHFNQGSPQVARFDGLNTTAGAGGQTASPTSATAAWTVGTATTASGSVTAAPASGTAAWVVPSVTITAAVAASPASAASAWAAPDPTAAPGGVTAAPASGLATWTATAPTIATGGVSETPASGASTWAVPTPTVVAGNATATPSPAVTTWTANDPSFTADGSPQTAQAAPAPAAWTLPAAQITATITVVPDAAVAAWVVPAPTVSTAVTASPVSALSTWALPAVSATGVSYHYTLTDQSGPKYVLTDRSTPKYTLTET